MANKNDVLILADSNVYIDLLRAGRDPAEVLIRDYGAVDLVTCGIVKLEVLRGIKVRKAFELLRQFFSVQQFVDSDFGLWEEATDLARTLARAGATLPAPDLIIAVSAFRTGASVLTADKHFSLIPNLPVIQSPYHP